MGDSSPIRAFGPFEEGTEAMFAHPGRDLRSPLAADAWRYTAPKTSATTILLNQLASRPDVIHA